MCKVRGMTTGSHECLAVCLGLAEEDFSENCTTWCQILLVQILAFKSAKTNIKEPQGCFRVRPRNAHVKRQFNFVKRHTTMNLPKTWWKTIQGSRLSSSQRRTCFPKTQARKGPSSNRANLHLELPGYGAGYGAAYGSAYRLTFRDPQVCLSACVSLHCAHRVSATVGGRGVCPRSTMRALKVGFEFLCTQGVLKALVFLGVGFFGRGTCSG